MLIYNYRFTRGKNEVKSNTDQRTGYGEWTTRKEDTYLLDPSTGEVKPYGMNDSTALFQSAGNVFITYLDQK